MSIKFRLGLMLFLQFFVWGAFFVPMGGYLGVIFASCQEQGTLNLIIGRAYATQTWAALFAPIIVGCLRLLRSHRPKQFRAYPLSSGGVSARC